MFLNIIKLLSVCHSKFIVNMFVGRSVSVDLLWQEPLQIISTVTLRLQHEGNVQSSGSVFNQPQPAKPLQKKGCMSCGGRWAEDSLVSRKWGSLCVSAQRPTVCCCVSLTLHNVSDVYTRNVSFVEGVFEGTHVEDLRRAGHFILSLSVQPCLLGKRSKKGSCCRKCYVRVDSSVWLRERRLIHA